MNDKRNFSRRKFIERSLVSAAGAGLAFSGSPLLAQSLQLNTEAFKPLRSYKIGIVGCGNRSKAIIGALNQVPDIEVGALCDIVPHKMEQRAGLIQNGPKPQFYTDIEKMVLQDDLDAVAVITPPDLHKDQTIAALEAGKHVFCEKPMALTVADCNEMIKAVERTHKALQIGTQRRHSGDYKMLVETIRNSPVGEILCADLFDYRRDWRVPEEDEYPPGVEYWRMDQRRSGGVVYEMGAHIIDVSNWVFDSEPLSVFSMQGVNNRSLRKRDSMDHGGVLVRYANNGFMNYGGSVYNYGPAAPDSFFGVNGSVQFGGGELSIHYGHPRGIPRQAELPEPEKKPLPKGGGVVEQLKYFAQVLAGKQKPYPDGHAGRMTVQICEGAVRSSQERKEIDVRELG